ncbi:MAG: hypothetical protein Q9166_002110 [cf. Caloplaca sp. 2 TL-2023]
MFSIFLPKAVSFASLPSRLEDLLGILKSSEDIGSKDIPSEMEDLNLLVLPNANTAERSCIDSTCGRGSKYRSSNCLCKEHVRKPDKSYFIKQYATQFHPPRDTYRRSDITPYKDKYLVKRPITNGHISTPSSSLQLQLSSVDSPAVTTNRTCYRDNPMLEKLRFELFIYLIWVGIIGKLAEAFSEEAFNISKTLVGRAIGNLILLL